MVLGTKKAQLVGDCMSQFGFPPLERVRNWRVLFGIDEDYALSVSFAYGIPDGMMETALFKGGLMVHNEALGYGSVRTLDFSLTALMNELTRLKDALGKK